MKYYLLALVVSTIISIFLGYIIIPILKKLKFGQPILKYVSEHKGKSGTPTMGGVFFILSTIITYFIFCDVNGRLSLMALTITVGFGIVGLIDDFLKIRLKNNLGLTPLQKTIFMLAVSILASIFVYYYGLNFVYIPFTINTKYLGYFSIILNVFVFIATVNGANLTDGIDGLLSSVSIVIFISLAVIISVQLSVNKNMYLIFNEYKNLCLFAVCFAGALLGYLVFNVNKASVFMGDTGSLAIGGAVSCIAIFSGNTLYIPLLGLSYVLSVVSVIIQVIYFKITKGKRVFLMSPLHHHFQQKGYSECKITYVYTLITAILGLVSIYFIMR